MKFISTRGGVPPLSFTDVLLQGLARDGGLFVPAEWIKPTPILSTDTYADIAFKVISPFTSGAIPDTTLKKIIADTYSPSVFENGDVAPLAPLGNKTYLMELFHGPTLAFKDVALQFLGRMFDAVLEQNGQHITIVGATSGDTGSAAIEACKGRKNISITILHPHGRTSDIQRRQMTSVMADNVHNIAIEGTFDDCQNLVKRCFADTELRATKNLSAVNSINWARIIAQTVYYVTASHKYPFANFAVPTGNFGNVYAAYVGKRMGANIGKLVIGSNRNDILTRFFESGTMELHTVTPSHSPSMDIQISSNFERVLFDILDKDSDRLNAYMTAFKNTGTFTVTKNEHEKLRAEFMAYRVSDDETVDTIAGIYRDHHILIDPHTAVGVSALNQSGLINGTDINIALACAHPAKFPDVVKRATGVIPELPAHLSDILQRPEKYQVMANDFVTLRNHLMMCL